MELYIFGRFLVLDGKESAFEAALGEVVTATRAEAGCLEVHGYRGVRNARRTRSWRIRRSFWSGWRSCWRRRGM
jgi:quinol monooxygenase YgiN